MCNLTLDAIYKIYLLYFSNVAAHCVMNESGLIARDLFVVRVGQTHLHTFDQRSQEHKVRELIVHPEYSVVKITHDTALIKLESDITYKYYIQPICLWSLKEDENAISGSLGAVVGFDHNVFSMAAPVAR